MIKPYLLSFAVTAAVFSCKNGNIDSTSDPSVSNGQNPETKSRNTDIPPAFAGQTRITGVRTTTPFQATALQTNLGKPWSIINFPNGRFLVTEKSGFAYIISADGSSVAKVTGFPAVDDKGQGGLLDIALDPNFSANRTVYWCYSEKMGSGNHTAVAKGQLSADEKTIQNPTVIFRATPTYDGDKHYGSRLVFDNDGNLFVSTGERSDMETRPNAQNQQTYYGKVIKITKNGAAAPGNPTISGWKPEIYTTGHRNPQGTAIHPVTGELWLNEMGPKGGDEVNRIVAGKNYGWPTITYGEEYTGATIGDGIGQKQGLEQPVYFWDPSVSPSGMDFYTGNIPEWKNNLMIGCLSGEKIIRLVIRNNKVVGEEWLLGDLNERFRDVLNGSDGNMYAVTDSGKLYRVSKK